MALSSETSAIAAAPVTRRRGRRNEGRRGGGRPLSASDRVMHTAFNVVLGLVAIAFFLPLLLVVSSSLSTEASINADGYSFIPRQFSTFAYRYILGSSPQLFISYGVSIVVTAVGTTVSLLTMSMLAYTLAQPDYKLRKPLSFYVLFTMLFNGGLVPSYILITRYLHLQDTILVLILPYLVMPFYVLLLRTYFSQLPRDYTDAARIDGAGEWRIFWNVILPIARPALATVGLFVLLGYWNDWWLGLLYIQNDNLVPVQLYLYRVLTNIDFLASNQDSISQLKGVPIQTAKMAAAVLAIGPIVVAFFAVQRFLVRGITVGGIKD